MTPGLSLAATALLVSAAAAPNERIQLPIDVSTDIELRAHAPFESSPPYYYDATLTSQITVSLPAGWALVASARTFLDGRDRLEPNRPDQSQRSGYNRRLLIGDQLEVDPREAYVSGPVGPVFLTLGKQQIVWGKADGVRVLDIVNPHSFREFILADFDQSRIPLWSARAEMNIGDAVLEGAVIADPTYSELAPTGGEFAFTSDRFRPPSINGAPSVLSATTVQGDVDYGARLSGFTRGWDYSFVYFRHTEDTPAFITDASVSPSAVTAFQGRSHLIGGSFANAFGDLTMRFEAGAILDRVLTQIRASSATPPDTATSFEFVIGADWYGFRNTLISLQIYQDRMFRAVPIGRPRNDTFVTAAFQRTALNERLKGRIRVLSNLNDGDAMIQGEAAYQLRDGVSAFASSAFFFGCRCGVFGQFQDADRMTLGLRLSF